MDLEEKIDQIIEILKGGNGDPGVCEKVRNNEREIGYLKKKAMEFTKKFEQMPLKWRSWLTFAITILTFIVLLYVTYKSKGGG